MASGFSTAYSNTMLDHIFRGTAAPTYPTALWVAAFTASNATSFLQVNDAASAVEVSLSGTAYTRVAIMAATGIDWAVATNGQTSQDSDIVFPTATASWGTVYAIALMTASSGGNVFTYGSLTTPRLVSIPDVFRVPLGQFIVTI